MKQTKQFRDFSLNSHIITTLEKMGIHTPTEIQEKSLPILMVPGKNDFHGQAQTGTGKTLAFGIPLLHHIDLKNKETQSLIVAPTRELALQIYESLEKLARGMSISITTIYGGVSFEPQRNQLKKGTQIVVGTPGRINDHLRRKTLSLRNVHTIVLDEADIMLDMGFKEEIDEILTFSQPDRNIWLFSATIKGGIKEIQKNHMRNPSSVRVSQEQVTSSTTQQYFCIAPTQYRFEALCRFIASEPDFYGFVFCQTKIQTSEIAEKLAAKGHSVNALHGDMSQVNRNRVITDFRKKKFSILIATDVAARGIDVSDITHVINYQIPEDRESYVHRIGRTGRAGKEGVSITFIHPREQRYIRELAAKFKSTIKELPIPSVECIMGQQEKKALAYVAAKIESTTSSKKQLSNLYESIQQLSDEQRNTLLIELLHEKFFNQVNTDTLTFSNKTENNRSSEQGFIELCINIGMQDGVTRNDILHHLTIDEKIVKKQIAKVRVIQKRSFILIPQKAQGLVAQLEQKQFKGRRWRLVN
ncbi:MAG: DEAD/DEAH box helicase [Candidatus Babeliales bacterium]